MSDVAKDRATRQAALSRLAVALQHRLPETKADRDAFFTVYLDDLGGFSTATFVAACRWLETRGEFFPKKPELLAACQMLVRQRQDRNRPRLAIPAGDRPADPVRIEEFKARVQAHVDSRRMPGRRQER